MTDLQVGDKVAYMGQHRFGMKNWTVQKSVCPGDMGTIVEMGHSPQWWRVDFGEERLVVIFQAVLDKNLYKKVVDET